MPCPGSSAMAVPGRTTGSCTFLPASRMQFWKLLANLVTGPTSYNAPTGGAFKMIRHWGFPICVVLLPAALAAQASAPSAAPAGGRAAGPPRPATVEGQPIETRPTEKKDNAPAFPEQTRAPYHATAPFKVTTLIDNLHAPWSIAFLPSGKIIVTERLPGAMRIL